MNLFWKAKVRYFNVI